MPFERRYDGDEPMRVNKWLGQIGVCSRREAEALIASGAVRIDGDVVSDTGRKIEPGQTLSLDDAGQSELASGVTVVLHKPVGYVSGQPEPGKVPAARLLTAANLDGVGSIPRKDASLPPIGRLDEDSRGLLLLSTDGVVAKAVIGPQSALDKEYIVTVRGEVTERKLTLLRHGLELDGRRLKPARVTMIERQVLRFILTEGRNRQIRRMCDLVSLRVTDLLRVRIGPLQLGGLAEGRWRAITVEEREALIEASRPPA